MVKAELLCIAAAMAGFGAYARPAQPYAGLETRSIKALSEEQTADLRAGRAALLSEEQMQRYAALRGYADAATPHEPDHHGHPE